MNTPAAQVISVSRRTDIPAFYAEWFINRVRAGFAQYRNPFGGKMYEVSLRADDVMAFVFWSRNYTPLLPYLPELDERGYDSYFHFTMTDYGQPLEQFTPPAAKMIAVFKRLAERYSPQHVLWRFDPIILSTITPAEQMLERFESLARKLSGFTERCYISFVDFYRKTEKNLQPLSAQGVKFFEPTSEEKLALVRQMVEIGNSYHIRLYACCEDVLLNIKGVEKAHCVDAELLRTLFPQKFHPLKPTPTREECGCFASRDIGAYDTCVHGCRYCYANSSDEKAQARFAAHDAAHACLSE